MPDYLIHTEILLCGACCALYFIVDTRSAAWRNQYYYIRLHYNIVPNT